jgi:hypothetical protein
VIRETLLSGVQTIELPEVYRPIIRWLYTRQLEPEHLNLLYSLARELELQWLVSTIEHEAGPDAVWEAFADNYEEPMEDGFLYHVDRLGLAMRYPNLLGLLDFCASIGVLPKRCW